MFKKLFSWLLKKESKPSISASEKVETVDSIPDSQTSLKVRHETLTEQAKAASDADYERFTATFNSFDPRNPPTDITHGRPLKAVEKSFLKYMIGKPIVNPLIAGKWYYEAKMNIGHELAALVNDGYLTYGPDLKKLKVAELKQLLAQENMSTTGKKADLIARAELIPPQRLQELFPESLLYQATPLGQSAIDEVVKSMAVDPDFEEKVFSLLMANQYDQAYALVRKFRNDSMPYQSLGGSSTFALPKDDDLRPRISKIKKMASSPEMAALVIYAKWMGIGNKIHNLCKLRKQNPDEAIDLMFFAQTGKIRKKLEELLEQASDRQITVGKPKQYHFQNAFFGEETNETETKFINSFYQFLSLAGWNANSFGFKRIGKSLCFLYKDCQIGRLEMTQDAFSMQFITKDDVLWKDLDSIEDCVNCTRLWLKYAKYIRRDF